MGIKQPLDLCERVRQAAIIVLDREGSVGPLGLLQQMSLLQSVHVAEWRKGNSHYTPLEPHIQGSQEKRWKAFAFFADWVRELGLNPIEAAYVRTGVHGVEALQVTVSGDDLIERFYRTHFVRGDLPVKQAEKLKEKLNKAPELVAFCVSGEPRPCSECGEQLSAGDFSLMEKDLPLCITCADMDHLEFLPRGDATLTRRAKKASPLSAIVLQFNRRRKHYDRIGLLVTPDAIAQAEDQCAADETERIALRAKAAVRRAASDTSLVAEMTQLILSRFPNCSPIEAQQLAEHTAVRGSGRVGRSAAGRSLDPRAIELAVIAWIRHQHTDYDSLLMQGVERFAAREQIQSRLDERLRSWRK